MGESDEFHDVLLLDQRGEVFVAIGFPADVIEHHLHEDERIVALDEEARGCFSGLVPMHPPRASHRLAEYHVHQRPASIEFQLAIACRSVAEDEAVESQASQSAARIGSDTAHS